MKSEKNKEKEITYAIDLDGTLCTQNGANYGDAQPYLKRIEWVNDMFAKGHKIKIFTARGATSGFNWHSFTEAQLRMWGVKYHELITNKPHFDVLIDDKAYHPDLIFKKVGK